jgi:hypothetical protein
MILSLKMDSRLSIRPSWLCLASAVAALFLVSSTTAASIPRSRSFAHLPSTSSITSTFTNTFDDLPLSRLLLLNIRGGSDEEDFSDEEEDFSDDEDFFDDFELGDEGEDDFAEDNTLDRMVQAFQKTPPLTKGYLTASFLATAAGYVLNKNVFPPLLVLDWKKVATRGQIWRPFTTFFYFGPFGLGYVMTVRLVWICMSSLERLHHHKPYDFWIMIVFGMLSMVVGYLILNLNARFLGHNLSTFLVYVWSRYHEGMEVNMFELFNTRAELLPWFFLAQVCTTSVAGARPRSF